MGGLRGITFLALVLLAACAPRPTALRAPPDPARGSEGSDWARTAI